MDTNGVKPPQERKDLPSTMQEMMEEMCRSGESSPADMCRRMMGAMRGTPDAQAPSAPGTGTTSDERGSSSHDEAHRGSCGPRSCCAPKRS